MPKRFRSRLGFFRSGVMIPCFRAAGKLPFLSDRLTILGISAARTPKQSFNSWVGRGSRDQERMSVWQKPRCNGASQVTD